MYYIHITSVIIFSSIILSTSVADNEISASEALYNNDIEIIPNDHNVYKLHSSRKVPIMFMISRHEKEINVDECDDSEFPPFFTPEQLRQGAIVVCLIIGIYCFTFLAIVCDKYFIPCVARLCETFNITEDVAGATFMAMATTAPEFFINVIGTFITESDIGIGTVVGSNMYNTLAVPALGCLAATSPIQLDWWPVARDCFIYICTIALLVGVTWNGYIYWYKSLIMFIALILYFIILFNNKPLSKFFKNLFSNYNCANENHKVDLKPSSVITIDEEKSNLENSRDEPETENIFEIPQKGILQKILFFYLWPIKFFLFVLLPNPNKKSYLYLLTFILSIVLIGLNSYVISWMITLIGGSLGIPDSVLGLTFLSFGGGLPETLAIVILTRKGESSIGVSNALGANTINILMSLGLPWFIKNITMGFHKGDAIEITSGSITYTILGLLLVVSILFVALYVNKFKLSKIMGIFLLIMYIILLTLAIVNEVLIIETVLC